MSDYEFVFDTMTWSFSRLNVTCPYEFYLHYIECNDSVESFYGQFGTFCHKILEKYASGELSEFELPMYYEDHFDEEVWMDAPPNKYKDIKEEYFNKGYDYFMNPALELDKYEILGIEKEVRFKIGEIDMVGYIDLLLKEKATGKIIIEDHKSGTLKILKNGQVSKTDADHFLEFKRQLYLYSKPVIEEFGRVDELRWNMYKDCRVLSVPWVAEEYQDALKWAENAVQTLRTTTEWLPKTPCGGWDYYCNNLCGQRENCIYNKKETSDEPTF